MKTPAFFLATLCTGALLLGSCSNDKTADTTTATTGMPADSAAGMTGGMAGMDHSKMADGTAAGASPQLAAMNEMMAKMDATKPKGNTDHDFAHMMLAHHRGAVAMADIELRDGKDATMRAMATKIKADQQREIVELEAFATRLDSAPMNYKPLDANDPFASKMKASMDDMMKNMPQPVANSDMTFNMLMTAHHQSAVDMAKAEVAYGKDTKLKQLAQQIIAAQEKEIAAFKDWHNQNGDKM